MPHRRRSCSSRSLGPRSICAEQTVRSHRPHRLSPLHGLHPAPCAAAATALIALTPPNPSDLELPGPSPVTTCASFSNTAESQDTQRQSPGTIGTGYSTTHGIKTDGPASLHRTHHHHPSSLSPHHPPHVHTCTSILFRLNCRHLFK